MIGKELALVYTIRPDTLMARRSVAHAGFVLSHPIMQEKGWWLHGWLALNGDSETFMSINHRLNNMGKLHGKEKGKTEEE